MGAAAPAGGRGTVIEFAAGICAMAAIVFAASWWGARARLRDARGRAARAEQRHARIRAMLATVPVAAFCWSDRDRAPAGFGHLPGHAGEALDYSAFLAALAAADRERVTAAVEVLRRDGRGFGAMVSTDAGAACQIEGIRTAEGETVLWLADMAPLRQAEEAHAAARREAQARRAMLDVLPVPVWRHDADLKVTDCNAAYAALLEVPRRAVIDGPGATDPTLTLARQALGASVAQERRHVVVDGARRMVEFTECPDSDGGATGGGTIGFALDLTALENAETELKRHVSAHRQVLESIHAAVAIYGPDKRLSFFNSAFSRLWSVEDEWLAGEPSLDELLERLREARRLPEYADFRAFRRQQLAMFTSLLEPSTELMHLPDGRTLSVSVSPHPLGGLVFVYEDVTDRLALERSYNTLIDVQRETLDNLFEGIAVFGSDGRLKLHNPAYRRMWGLSEQDVAGEPHFGDIAEKTRDYYDAAGGWATFRQQITGTITSQTPWSGQVDRRDGSILHLATVPLPDGNVLFTGLDVTDSATVERALRESNDALETAARLKSEFIANVSYELRTPLNAIIGFAEILTNQYFGSLSPRQLDYSRGILASSHRLMSLINDILDLATIEAGYMALDSVRIDIREMLGSVISLARERARAQDLTLTMSCPPDIGFVEGDERRLKQALFNLISNAMKFTPAGNSISLNARVENGDVILAVADTGIGIPAADQERIFEKFERGKPNSRDAGAGLGLSLVKSLVELHGGSVGIESEPGRGTTITCQLPGRLRLPAAQPAE